MGIEEQIPAALAAVQHLVADDRLQQFQPNEPFALKEDEIFAAEERVRVQIHHPAWAKMPLKQLHSHDFFELCYVHAGNFHQVIDGRPMRQTPETLVLLRPGSSHATWIDHQTDLVFNILLRKAVVSQSLLPVVSKRNPIREYLAQSVYAPEGAATHLLFRTSDRVRDLVANIIAEYYNGLSDFDDTLLAQVVMLLAELARTPFANSEPESPMLVDILAFIGDNFRVATQQSVAEHFNYSPRHLSRLLSANTGKSFPELVNAHKINAICARLDASTATSMSRLVQDYGFSSANYFYRVFRRERGLSFADFRRDTQSR